MGETKEKLEELYKKLDYYCERFDDEDDDYPTKFINTVDKVVEYQDPSSIPILLRYFDDDNLCWALEGLNGRVEKYNEEELIKAILCSIDFMVPKATDWVEGMLFDMLKTDSSFKILNDNFYLAHGEKILDIFNEMKTKTEKRLQSGPTKISNIDPQYYLSLQQRYLKLINELKAKLEDWSVKT